MITIKLTQQPYISGGERRLLTEDGEWSVYVIRDHYEALAADAEGNEYIVMWDIIEGWDGCDEADACDWEHPVYIECDFKNVTKNVVVGW